MANINLSEEIAERLLSVNLRLGLKRPFRKLRRLFNIEVLRPFSYTLCIIARVIFRAHLNIIKVFVADRDQFFTELLSAFLKEIIRKTM